MFRWIEKHYKDCFWSAAVPEICPDNESKHFDKYEALAVHPLNIYGKPIQVFCEHCKDTVVIYVNHYRERYCDGDGDHKVILQRRYGFKMNFMYPLITDALTRGEGIKQTSHGQVRLIVNGEESELRALNHHPQYANQAPTLYPLKLPTEYWEWIRDRFDNYPTQLIRENGRVYCPQCGHNITDNEKSKQGICWLCKFKEI